MNVDVKEVLVEAHQSIGKGERFHAPLQRSYEIIWAETRGEGLDKDTVLQIATKAINDTASLNRLVLTLLVFGVYPRMSYRDALSTNMIARGNTVRAAMKEVRRIQAVRKIRDT
jgi:hypothetical protein